MNYLGIDTSNYATSLAVISSAEEVVYTNKRFLPVKKGELGLRQSDAVFHHTNTLTAVIEDAAKAGYFNSVACVGVSEKPRQDEKSYMPCFLPGVLVGTAVAAAKNIKLYKVSHQQGHIAAALYGSNKKITDGRNIIFHVSGGTTEMLLCEGYTVSKRLGKSLDLYAGQAVDRLGVRLGCNFPAGEEVSALAMQCEQKIKPLVSVNEMNCNFSGLENRCNSLLEKGFDASYAAKFCLASIAETLYQMAISAREKCGSINIVFAGGVMSSCYISGYLKEKLNGVSFVSPQLSSDNAIGTALIALSEHRKLDTR